MHMLMDIGTDEGIQEVLTNYSDNFILWDLFSSLFRWLGWVIIKGLTFIADACEKLMDSCYNVFFFFLNDKFSGFYDYAVPLMYLILTFCLIYLAYVFLIAQEKPKELLTNIVLFVFTLTCLNFMITELSGIVMNLQKNIKNYGVEQDAGSDNANTVLNGIVDLTYLDSQDFKITDDSQQLNSLKQKDIQYIDINETVDTGEDQFDNLKNPKVFKKRLVLNDSGEYSITKNGKFLGLIKKWYYRYDVDWVNIMMTLLALIIMYIFTAYKTVKIEYEIGLSMFFAVFIAAGDLSTGQRIKKLITGVIECFVALLSVVAIQKIFTLFAAWLSLTDVFGNNSDVSTKIIKAVILLFFAFVSLDGPMFIEKIFNIDAGVKSTLQSLQGLYYASHMMPHPLRDLRNMQHKAAGAANKMGEAAAYGAGVLSGVKGNQNQPIEKPEGQAIGSGDSKDNQQKGVENQPINSGNVKDGDNQGRDSSLDNVSPNDNKTMNEDGNAGEQPAGNVERNTGNQNHPLHQQPLDEQGNKVSSSTGINGETTSLEDNNTGNQALHQQPERDSSLSKDANETVTLSRYMGSRIKAKGKEPFNKGKELGTAIHNTIHKGRKK